MTLNITHISAIYSDFFKYSIYVVESWDGDLRKQKEIVRPCPSSFQKTITKAYFTRLQYN